MVEFINSDYAILSVPFKKYCKEICYDYEMIPSIPQHRNMIFTTIAKGLQEKGKIIIDVSDTYYKHTASLHITIFNTQELNMCIQQITNKNPQIKRLQIQFVNSEGEKITKKNNLTKTDLSLLYDLCIFKKKTVLNCNKQHVLETTV